MAMSFLSMMEAKLPPGFRFHPRDEELIDDYLANRITGDQSNGCPMLVDVDLNKVEPWDLPDYACVGRKEWYFYSQRDKKYATGQRTNRATLSGYWKATGKDRQVADGRKGGKLVGMRKTLVFYKGRAPKGKKTDWVMHEFRMEGDHPKQPPSSSSSSSSASAKEDWVLCRVFYKSRGISPKPNTTENCFDDTGTSSLPPLMDTYINFEQPPQLLNDNKNNNNNNNNNNSSSNNNNSNLHGFNEQVPCFSNLRHSVAATAFNHLLPSPLPPPLVDTNLLPNKSLPPPSASQLGSLPAMGAYLNPLMSFCCEKKAIKAVLDHISKAPEARSLAESSENFLTEAGAHSMWNSF